MFHAAAGIMAGFGLIAHGFMGGTASTTVKVHPPMVRHAIGTSTPRDMLQHRVIGVVSGINGMTLTVDGWAGTTTATTTFTVNASNAKVVKGKATTTPSITLSSLVVGDRIMVHGDIAGTVVTAKLIIAGIPDVVGKHAKPFRGEAKGHFKVKIKPTQ